MVFHPLIFSDKEYVENESRFANASIYTLGDTDTTISECCSEYGISYKPMQYINHGYRIFEVQFRELK